MRRSRHQFVIASRLVGEAIQKKYNRLDCFVGLLAMTAENYKIASHSGRGVDAVDGEGNLKEASPY